MEWKKQKLSDIASVFEDGDWIESKDQSSKGVLLVQTGNVGVILYRNKEVKHFVSEQTFKRLNCTEIYAGDILISRLPDPIGRSCIIPKLPYRMMTAVDCAIFRPKDEYNTRYLNYLLNAEQSRTQVYKMVTGSTRKRISRKNLGDIELSIPFKDSKPNLAEQMRIADKLDKVFAEIEKGQRMTIKQQTFAESIRHSYLKNMYEDTNIPQLSLSALTSLQSGFAYKSVDYENNGFSLIRIANVKNGYIDDTNQVFVPRNIAEEKAQFILKDGDILISLTGNVGRVGIIKKEHLPAVLNQRVSKFVIQNDAVLPEYLFHMLNCRMFEETCIAFGKGAAQKNISNEEVLTIPIPIPMKNGKPDLAEQKRIIDELDEAFALSEQLGNLFDKQERSFASLRVSVLNEAFAPKTEAIQVAVPAQSILAPRPFGIQQAVASVLKRFERGEMVVAKMLYFAQKIYQVPLGIQFSAQNFGPYDSAVKKAVMGGLSQKQKFFFRKNIGGRQVLALGANANKVLQYSNSTIAKKMKGYLDEMMPLFSRSDSVSIERLATICKIIEDTKTTDEKVIREKLHEWKPNKFQDAEVSRTIDFIKQQKWDAKLIT